MAFDTVMTRREAVRVAAWAAQAGAAMGLAGCGGGARTSGEEAASGSEARDSATSGDVVATVVESSAEGSSSVPSVGPATELSRLLDAGKVGSIRLIGDSITAGWGCDGYGAMTDRVIYDGGYGYFNETAPEVACLANDFRAYANGRGVGEFVNAGIPGAKMLWLAEEPEAWIREGADVIFVMLGTNDAVYSTREEYRQHAETGLAAVAAACQLMVVVSPPINDRSDSGNLYGPEVLDEILRGVCEEHGYLHVSLLDSIELHTSDFNDDQCHPTSSGSHKMWERLRLELGL